MGTQGRELRRHFFREYLESDLVAPGVDQHAGAAIVLGALLTPGIMLPLLLSFKYGVPWWSVLEREGASWEDKLLFVLLSMIASGFVSLAAWDALQPARRDRLVLGPLPLRPGVIVRAQVASLAVLVLAVNVASMGAGPVLFALVMVSGSSTATWTGVARTMAGHAAACLMAGAWVFLCAVSTNAVLFNILGAASFRRAGSVLRVIGAAGLAGLFLSLPLLIGRVEALVAAPPWWAEWAPPLWFLGVWEYVAGHGDAWWTRLAWRGVWSTSALAVVALCGLVIGYARRLGGQNPVSRTTAGGGQGIRRLLRSRVLFGSGIGTAGARACFAFSLQTLARSAPHRLVVGAILGAGLACAAIVLAQGARGATAPPGVDGPSILAVQHILTLSIAVGIRFAAAFPAELPASWVFSFLSTGRVNEWILGVKRAALWAGALPVILLTWPLTAMRFGVAAAMIHAIVGFVASAGWVDVLFVGVTKAPFSSTLEAGRGGPKARWPVYFVAFLSFIYVLVRVEDAAMGSISGRLALVAGSAAVYAAIRGLERITIRTPRPPRFDDGDDWDFQSLDLSR